MAASASSSAHSSVQTVLNDVKAKVSSNSLDKELNDLLPLSFVRIIDRQKNPNFYNRMILIGVVTSDVHGVVPTRNFWGTRETRSGKSGYAHTVRFFIEVDNDKKVPDGLEFSTADLLEKMGEGMLFPFRDLWIATASRKQGKRNEDKRRGMIKSLMFWYFLNHAVHLESQGLSTETFEFADAVKNYFIDALKALRKLARTQGATAQHTAATPGSSFEAGESGAELDEEAAELWEQSPYEQQSGPALGQQQSAFGQQQSAFGQQQSAFGQQRPDFGQQQPAFGQQHRPAVEETHQSPFEQQHRSASEESNQPGPEQSSQPDFTQENQPALHPGHGLGIGPPNPLGPVPSNPPGRSGWGEWVNDSTLDGNPIVNQGTANAPSNPVVVVPDPSTPDQPQQAAPAIGLLPAAAATSASDTVPTLHIPPEITDPFSDENEPKEPRVWAHWDAERQRHGEQY
ncbi:hypothetical protein K491DRAFT_674297 [Lophiostoma macrostomum CBS 122681]|uniref:Uncharacterized protein n=1 Tax=Lophiostoma macrostomum CBS 122681 TaxID=1314788 RepID=A0A6A6TNT2_9PLEO|nr:hypothetical protein K491DRAFT_674297 [Lophiostoma macrostomum CBS 122681]